MRVRASALDPAVRPAVFSPKSPGDGRGIYNVRAKLRRAGLNDTNCS